MSITAKFSLIKVRVNTFAVNNAEPLPGENLFYYSIAFNEVIDSSAQSVTIIILVNIFLDAEHRKRIGSIETSCVFIIHNFSEVVEVGAIPDQILASFLGISISTTRGILLAKSAGTRLESFILPIISPIALVNEKHKKIEKPLQELLLDANNFFELGNYQQAIKLYNKILGLEPDNLAALFNRSKAYHNSGAYEEAVKDLTTLLAKYPDYAPAYNNLANAFTKLNNYEGALMNYDKAIELVPDDPEYHYNKGVLLLYSLNNYHEAIKEFDKAIATNSYPLFYVQKAVALFHLKQFQETSTNIETALSLDPDLFDANILKAQLLNHLGQFLEAVEFFTRAIELAPNEKEAYNGRADTYRKLKKYDVAKVDAEKAISLDPTFNLAYGTLAETYGDLGDDELFYETLEKALRLGFRIDKYIQDNAYDKYRKEPKFIDLLNKYSKAAH